MESRRRSRKRKFSQSWTRLWVKKNSSEQAARRLLIFEGPMNMGSGTPSGSHGSIWLKGKAFCGPAQAWLGHWNLSWDCGQDRSVGTHRKGYNFQNTIQ